MTAPDSPDLDQLAEWCRSRHEWAKEVQGARQNNPANLYRAARQPLALAYARVSTAEQGDRGISLEAQRQALHTLAAAKGFTLAHIYEDIASGTTLDRPGLQALLSRLAVTNRRRKTPDSRIAAVLVCKLDRLSRDLTDGIGLAVRFQAAGASLVSLEDGVVNREDPTQELLYNLRLILARFEARQTAARTRFALQAKRDRGERAGTIPYGYRLITPDSDHLEEHPDEQAALSLLSTLRTAGASLRATAAELNSQGFRTRSGNPWRFEYVRNLDRHRSRPSAS